MTHKSNKKAAALTFILTFIATMANAQAWNFANGIGDTDVANLNADDTNWKYESNKERWGFQQECDETEMTANGATLEFTKGLLFTGKSNTVRVDNKTKCLNLNGTVTVKIKDVKKDAIVTVSCKTSSKTTARGLSVTNITPTSGLFNDTSLDTQTNVGTVADDGDITLTSTGGLYVYSIEITTAGDTKTETTYNSVSMNTSENQMRLHLNTHDIKYYDTDEVGVAIDDAAGTVTVSPKTGAWTDVYAATVEKIDFAKKTEAGSDGVIENSGVEITEAKGWLESLYVKWNPYDGATSYNVYVQGGQYSDYTKIDYQLVRDYDTYCRADIVGLQAGPAYSVKVVAVDESKAEMANSASTASAIAVKAYDRSGFAHFNYTGVGAYNDDGTLKSDARIVYVTAETAKTVELPVFAGKTDETFTGIQAIVNAYQKGKETRPLCIRLIGTVTDSDVDYLGSSSEGLQVKGKNNTIPMNITIEGIGDDATIWGFGLLLRNAASVELRNFAIMLCMDDCVSLDTDNKNCWVHHLDLFYGQTGGDSDQAKGDGTLDVKGDSQYMTFAYNHLYDCGKSSLCGMKSESGPNYIDYHHNWFDHSDSRHPRVRTMTVHVWNNYYDGVAKYGVGATMGSSVFVENNYFRNTKNPMLSSKQGRDAMGDGTFSGENGGMIKSFGNVYADNNGGGSYTPIAHTANATSFDCYEATARDEQVPATYTTLAGGTTYDNFDTDASLMYEYTPDAAANVPAIVTGYYGAGRMNHGDFKWTFDNSSEDSNYSVITALKTALQNYKSGLKGIFNANE